MKKLDLHFYNRPTLIVAQELLGKIIHFNNFKIIINETEAYVGKDDPACHAFRGVTPRTEIMFGRAGYSYVYFIYGMYYCLNFVTEEIGDGCAVLIRGGVDINTHENFNGPGKLCRYLGITKDHNKIDLINDNNFFVTESSFTNISFKQTPRIGISKGIEKLWRFHTDLTKYYK